MAEGKPRLSRSHDDDIGGFRHGCALYPEPSLPLGLLPTTPRPQTWTWWGPDGNLYFSADSVCPAEETGFCPHGGTVRKLALPHEDD